MSDRVDISVVIPVYNGQDYILDCLDSLQQQTYPYIEVIVVNDGSTDSTQALLDQAKTRMGTLTCITIDNHGQGYARNYAIPLCKGAYICFVDADDTLAPQTLERAYERAQQDKADVVVFDWQYVGNATVHQPLSAPYFDKPLLKGEDCLELLQTSPFFTVNKLYAKSFLQRYNIRYGEGHIYEDNPFWVNVCIHAQTVSLIAEPLYRVRVNEVSSTKTRYHTDWHSRSFITAVRTSFAILETEEKPAFAYLYRYFFERFCLYYSRRTPRRFRAVFLREFVDAMAQRPLSRVPGSRFYNLCLERGVFQKKRYGYLRLMLFFRMSSQALARRLKSKNIG